jgi:hypothetical protein
LWILSALLLAPLLLTAEETFPSLQAAGQTYSNVTVTSKTRNYIVIMHSQGMTSIKLRDLSTETCRDLGYDVAPASPPPKKPLLSKKIELDPRAKEMRDQVLERVEVLKARIEQLDRKWLMGGAGGLLVIYLFVCQCFKLICKKAGQKPGLLVWIPLLQIFPLLKAARMSGWWVVMFLVPILNVWAGILWCVKICKARGKPAWLALPLVLPVTSLFTFLYLAFADPLQEEPAVREKITFN